MPTTRTKSSAGSTTTTDHDFIRKWAEERGGQPACVKGTGGGSDPGMIRLDFPGWSGEESLQPISWDEWFKAFDDNKLALLYQETTKDGEQSRFNKLVSRSTSRSRAGSSSGSSRSSGSSSRSSGSHAKSGGSGSTTRSSTSGSSSTRSSSPKSAAKSSSGTSGRKRASS